MNLTRHSFLLVATVAVLLVAFPGPADDPPKGGGSNSPDRKPIPPGQPTAGALVLPLAYDVVIRGDRCWVGQYDADGNFVPDPSGWSFPRNAAGVGGLVNGVLTPTAAAIVSSVPFVRDNADPATIVAPSYNEKVDFTLWG